MLVPNAHASVVEESKVVDYLLNLAHPNGASKARFFVGLGFDAPGWRMLAEELRKLVAREQYLAVVESKFGWKYIVDGEIHGPDGLQARIRSVWIRDSKNANPRLITAYPQT